MATSTGAPAFGDERIRGALESGRVGVWHWNVATDEVHWSPNLETIHRLPPGTFKGDFRSFADDIHPDDRTRVMAAIQDALARGGGYNIQYRLPPEPDGTEYWIEAKGEVVTDATGTYMRGVCQDVSDHKHLQLELADRLKQQEVVANLGQEAIEAEDLQYILDRAVAVVKETLDVDMAGVLERTSPTERLLLRSGIGWHEGVVGSVRVGGMRLGQNAYTLAAGEPVVVEDFAAETRFKITALLQDHNVVSSVSILLPGPDDTAFGVLGVHTTRRRSFTRYDVNFLQSVAYILGGAVRKAHSEHMRDLLYEELRHRVSNLFQVILSIHRQTAQSCDTIAEVEKKFRERIVALATTHEEIARGAWTTVPLKVLLDKLLFAYADRAEMTGAPVLIPAETAFSLSLALNELATNAGKYGCFAHDGGRLRVSWRIEDGDRLEIDWIETCAQAAPPAGGAATRTGFGSRLIAAVIEQQLHGTLERTYAESGLRVRLTVPLDRSQQHSAA